jgi:para-nitrobenzyl esterase
LPPAITLALASTAVAQTVTAPVGQIVGAKDSDLMFYQGIPYAKPPVGKLRWAAPVPVETLQQPFQANSAGNECVQKAIFWRPDKTASWTEDCLTLNIYAPSCGGSNLPVFVGFHGGGSINGAKTDWDPRDASPFRSRTSSSAKQSSTARWPLWKKPAWSIR